MMSFDKVEKAINEIVDLNISFEYNGEKTKGIITKAQEILECKLPLSYLSFLERYGNFSMQGFYVSGIITDDVYDLRKSGIVWKTLKCRDDSQLPDYIILLNDGWGDGACYALDLSQMNKKNECPVVIWPLTGFKYSPHLEVVAPDFGTWFLEMVEQQIAIKNEDANL